MYLVFLCDMPTQFLCYAYHPPLKQVLLSSNGPATRKPVEGWFFKKFPYQKETHHP